MSFSSDVDAFVLSFNEGAEDAVRGTTIKLWSAIIKSSPVDEGRFRANWLATFGDTDKTVDSKDRSGSRATNKATNAVLKQKDFSQFTLTNNLPYGETIEFGRYGDGPETSGGYSKQAPQGVVRVNVKRFNTLLEQEAKRKLPK